MGRIMCMEENIIDYNLNRAKVTAFILAMPTYLDVLFVIVKTLGLGVSSLVSALFYVVVLIYIIFRCNVDKNNLYQLLVLYSLLLLHYIIFPQTRSSMVSQSMIIVYCFFLPYGMLVIKEVNRWYDMLDYLYKFSVAAIVMGGFMLAFLPYNKYLIYMDYSYSLLPSICACYYHYKELETEKGNDKLALVFFGVGCLEILIFGARSCILFAVMFVVIVEILRSDNSMQKKVVFTSITGIVGIVGNLLFDDIMMWLASLPMFQDSYFIVSFLRGHLFSSDSRDLIYENCIERIKTMGLEVGGFFSDREYCGSVYPHNIIYEILMSWGWIFGGIFILYVANIIIKGVLLGKIERIICIFIVISCFSRYFVSGSYVIEGKFWTALFVLIAINKCINNSNTADNDEVIEMQRYY